MRQKEIETNPKSLGYNKSSVREKEKVIGAPQKTRKYQININ